MTSSRSRKRRSSFVAALAMLLLAAAFTQCAAASPVFVSSQVPRTAEAGQPIPISVNITSQQPIHDVQGVRITFTAPEHSPYNGMNLTLGNHTAGTWSYEIPAQPWEGRVEFFITAVDGSGNSARYPASGTASIEILGEAPPRPFPWNIVMIIGFLGVALVLTELVFKPGFYRPTGRERARKLEEEDREREKED